MSATGMWSSESRPPLHLSAAEAVAWEETQRQPPKRAKPKPDRLAVTVFDVRVVMERTRDVLDLARDVAVVSPSRELSLAITKLEEAEMWSARALTTKGEPCAS